jgi:hypothetical protein
MIFNESGIFNAENAKDAEVAKNAEEGLILGNAQLP